MVDKMSNSTFVNCLPENNKNTVEDVVSGALITKSFYFMLNIVVGYFSTPSR